ncbi:MAG TPA: hypothetical protein PKZ32_22550, partial [Candidatus Melainabacteria bacterium]|nr:hypothetical protein [Candidatus Melainabacteria bacterium]
LSNNLITDEGVKYISNIPSLEWLDLSRTKVTPKCLDSLLKLKKLRTLEIVPSAWSTAEVDAFSNALKEANPKIQIIYTNEVTLDPSVLLPFRWGTAGLHTHTNLQRIIPDGANTLDPSK